MTKSEIITALAFLMFLSSVIGYTTYIGYSECNSEHLKAHNGAYKLGCSMRGE
jgi:hypothetical protein